MARLSILYPEEENGRSPTWCEVSSWLFMLLITGACYSPGKKKPIVHRAQERRTRVTVIKASPGAGSTDFVVQAKQLEYQCCPPGTTVDHVRAG